ncbi:SRPBCC family protein [Nannocystis radixulma]|uniref:SRPBCC family protein n=1 Tax=Nannocystis radixulma TaxID=2995305 RepID=A0ABT5BL67_9BACT|nr:SRPBCC family protein [Nannocystis radixulma]MDC0674335.1 SRPBCC family protein [Nannocystis radixulma]
MTTTTTDKPSFVYVLYIATTAEKLWEALTQGDFTEKYWGGRRVESTWQPGAPIVYRYDEGRKTDITGEVLRCEAPTLLSYTFGVDHGEATEPASRVTFELKPLGAMVRLTLTHDQFPEGSKVLQGVSRGWPGILSNLKSYLELGKPMPFGNWDRATA